MSRHPLAAARLLDRVRYERPRDHQRPLGARLSPRETAPSGPTHEHSRDAALAAVEAALFLADEPLAARKLAALAGLADGNQARAQVLRLQAMYAAEGSAFEVEEIAGGYQLLTRAEFHPWLARLRSQGGEAPLSAAGRETLTIVAYRQPITRADIEAIRGVGAAEVLRQLMERGLIRLAGRDDTLGRPALYETTRKFLLHFGLRSLRDLPPVEEKSV
jgi:segregation and condensation protein B